MEKIKSFFPPFDCMSNPIKYHRSAITRTKRNLQLFFLSAEKYNRKTKQEIVSSLIQMWMNEDTKFNIMETIDIPTCYLIYFFFSFYVGWKLSGKHLIGSHCSIHHLSKWKWRNINANINYSELIFKCLFLIESRRCIAGIESCMLILEKSNTENRVWSKTYRC